MFASKSFSKLGTGSSSGSRRSIVLCVPLLAQMLESAGEAVNGLNQGKQSLKYPASRGTLDLSF